MDRDYFSGYKSAQLSVTLYFICVSECFGEECMSNIWGRCVYCHTFGTGKNVKYLVGIVVKHLGHVCMSYIWGQVCQSNIWGRCVYHTFGGRFICHSFGTTMYVIHLEGGMSYF